MKIHYPLSRSSFLMQFVICFCFFMVFSAQEKIQASLFGPGKDAPVSFSKLADEVKHSVVNISTTKVLKDHPLQPFMNPDSPFREFFGDEFFKRFFGDTPRGKMKTSSLGSGVIIDRDGLILTNNHVIEKADEIKIKLQNGKEYDAKLVGRDPKTDLALIKVKPDSDFPNAAPLGNSDAIAVGDWVMAVGNPFGLGHTVTVGIISAKGRVIGAGPYDDFLQTDAAINPGNSGGPLFNMNGEIVGVNTAIVAQGQGIGFAIPVNMAKELLPQLKSGKIVRGWLGVMIQDITPELAKSFDVKAGKGVLIGDIVEDGPAAKSDLARGDIVTHFNGKEVNDAHELSRSVAAIPPGTQVSLDILRDGKPKTIQMKIGEMPEDETIRETTAKKETAWGLTVQNLTPDLIQKFGLNKEERGVIIIGVEPGSAAYEAKLRPGDLIKEINRQKIQNLRDYNQVVSDTKKDESLLILVKREDHTFYVVLNPSK